MKKITENALLFRVNQLKEKMAMFERTDANGNEYQGRGRGTNTATPPTATPPTATPPTATPPDGAFLGYKPYVAPAGTDANATTSTQPQMSPVQSQGQMSPVQTQGTPANQAINNMLATPATPPTAIPSGQAAPAPAGTKFPSTPAEIQAFQKAHGLKVDGLIGPNTLTALAKAGIQPPAGFKMAGAKHHPAPAPHPAQHGAAAKTAPKPGAAPGTVGYVDPKTGAVSSGDAERDERMAQFGQVAQMTPAQQQMFNRGAADQDAAAAGTAETGRPGTQADLDQFKKAFGNQTAPAGAAAITPNLQMAEGVTFGHDESLARIMQLVKW